MHTIPILLLLLTLFVCSSWSFVHILILSVRLSSWVLGRGYTGSIIHTTCFLDIHGTKESNGDKRNQVASSVDICWFCLPGTHPPSSGNSIRHFTFTLNPCRNQISGAVMSPRSRQSIYSISRYHDWFSDGHITQAKPIRFNCRSFY